MEAGSRHGNILHFLRWIFMQHADLHTIRKQTTQGFKNTVSSLRSPLLRITKRLNMLWLDIGHQKGTAAIHQAVQHITANILSARIQPLECR
ncbi:hypothetical protein AD947_08830 [Acetobacter tropicalis]|uniref:Transposase n=2 Tax=Acetobacter tropicalis TaxID=104102 RepID=A0A149TW60_9PROT|nr:hypothetical protein AD947_08830 [Acetobacter tropicalis]